jgi:L-asparaginase/Glu-tRNA(Gln) amidotransferase subunit D
MSAMLAITFVCSYLPELVVVGRPEIARRHPHIAMLTTAGQEVSDQLWLDLAARTSEALAAFDVDGAVIVHGAGSTEETAFFLALVVKSEKPFVLAGSPAAAARIDWATPPAPKRIGRSTFSIEGVTHLPRVDILYAHANMPLDLIEASVESGARGLIMAGAGDGDVPAVALQALATAARAGVVVVRSSRLERGLVRRNQGADDDALGLVASGGLNAAQSRVLLQLALLQTTDPARVQKMFDDY